MMTLADMLAAIVCMLQVFLIFAAAAILVGIFVVTFCLAVRWVIRRFYGD